MVFHSVWIFPVLATGFALAAFICGYTIAVGKDDAYAWFMYISDGGAKPPESCIFGQLLNLSAMFLAISSYIRHRQYVVYYGHYCKERDGWWRTTSLILLYIGFTSAFGMSIVANFNELAVPIVHLIGALLAFFGATIYCWGQVFLSYALKPHMTPLWLNHIRTALVAFATGSLALHLICEFVQPFVKKVNGVIPTDSTGDNIKKYHSDSLFYTNHLITTCAEWGLALSLEAIVLTFAWELREFYIHIPKLHLKPLFFAKTISTSETRNIIQPEHRVSFEQQSNTSIRDNETHSSSSSGIPRPKVGGKVTPVTKRNEYLY